MQQTEKKETGTHNVKNKSEIQCHVQQRKPHLTQTSLLDCTHVVLFYLQAAFFNIQKRVSG